MLRRLAVLACLCGAALIAPDRAAADCALIPAAIKKLPSTDGHVDRPFAAPGDAVTLFANVACKPSSANPFFSQNEASNRIRLIFDPLDVYDPDLPLPPSVTAYPSATGSFSASDVGRCVVGRCFAVEFVVPDTTDFGPMSGTGHPLTGPTHIEVYNAGVSGDPLVVDAGDPRVASIGPLFEPTKACNPKNRFLTLFEHFSVLPPRNTFSGGAATLLATVDGSGSLLLPFDYSPVLASLSGGSAELRLLEVTGDLPNGLAGGNGLAAPDGDKLRIPRPSTLSNFDFVRAFSLNGRPIPPLIEVTAAAPLMAGGVSFGDTIVGSVDFVDSVIRVAKAGPNPAAPGSAIQTFALKGEQLPSVGLELENGAGPIELPGLGLTARGAAPLSSLRTSGEAAAIARSESLEIPTATDLNGDLDTLDRIVEITDLATGQAVNTGMAVAEITQSPTKAVIVTEGDVAAFLQSEAASGNAVLNGDGDATDNILRAFTTTGIELTGGLPTPVTVDAAASIDGEGPLAISDGFLFFQRQEGEDVSSLTDGLAGPILSPIVLTKEPEYTSDGTVLAVSADLFAEGIIPDQIVLIGPAGGGFFVSDTSANGCAGSGLGDGESRHPSLSADGTTATFQSSATNLLAAPGNGGTIQIFAADLDFDTPPTGCVGGFPAPSSLEMVSQAAGAAGDFDSEGPDVSAAGRYVAFHSYATNLAAGDLNSAADVFLADRQLDTLVRLSVPDGGGESDGVSENASISADGRYVAFDSVATNLVAADTNGVGDVFVADRDGGPIERVSVPDDGGQANGSSRRPGISADGRFVAFLSDASNLVPGDTNGVSDVFVFDRQVGAVQRVSLSSAGVQADGAAVENAPALSADGRYVAFASLASNLVPADTNASADVFRFDRLTGTVTRMSVATGGGQGSGDSTQPMITADGQLVAFQTLADDLLTDDALDGIPNDVDAAWRTLGPGGSLNGDADVDDSVLFRLDLRGGPPSTARNTSVAAEQVSVAGGRALVIEGDRVVMIAEGGTTDSVASMSAVVDPVEVSLSEEAACVRTATGTVKHAVPASFMGGGGFTTTALSDATRVRAVGPKCVFTAAASGLRILEAGATDVPVTVGLSAEDFQVDPKGVAFRVCEDAEAVDLNEDGGVDATDCVMHFYDFALGEDGDPGTEPITNTGRTAIPCTFPGCDPFFEPYRLRGDVLSFVSRESHELRLGGGGRSPVCLPKTTLDVCDLNGDRDGIDVVVQILNLKACTPATCKAQVFPVVEENPPEVAPFPDTVAGDETVFAIQLPASLLGPEFAGVPPDQLITVIAGDADGDGSLEQDGILDEQLTVVDLCPEVENPVQLDADQDGLGAACDVVANPADPGTTLPNDDPITAPEPAEIPGESPCDLDRSGVISREEVDQVWADRGAAVDAPFDRDTPPDFILDAADDRDRDVDGEVSAVDFSLCLADCSAQPVSAGNPNGGCPLTETTPTVGGGYKNKGCGLLGIEAWLVLVPCLVLRARRRRARG